MLNEANDTSSIMGRAAYVFNNNWDSEQSRHGASIESLLDFDEHFAWCLFGLTEDVDIPLGLVSDWDVVPSIQKFMRPSLSWTVTRTYRLRSPWPMLEIFS